MRDYEEFKNLRKEEDKNNPFSALYFLESGESFYLEPVFYTQLMGFKDHSGGRGRAPGKAVVSEPGLQQPVSLLVQKPDFSPELPITFPCKSLAKDECSNS